MTKEGRARAVHLILLKGLGADKGAAERRLTGGRKYAPKGNGKDEKEKKERAKGKRKKENERKSRKEDH